MPLAGDASTRRYERLMRNGETAVLMLSTPDLKAEMRLFEMLAGHLLKQGLSAPRIFATDPEGAFLLLEDLGDALFARRLERDPEDETELYVAATDVLLALQTAELPSGITQYEPEMPELSALAVTWYAWEASGGDETLRARFQSEMAKALGTLPGPSVLALRDYHAENLLWLPEREGVAKVGLLDFQDAKLTHPVYDLVSLLQDARRDVGAEAKHAALAHFIERSPWSSDQVNEALAILGAQRNLRILGVFARLSLHFGKARYVDLIPRVWGHLQDNLSHPSLAALATLCADTLPEPTSQKLASLREKCGTVPNL